MRILIRRLHYLTAQTQGWRVKPSATRYWQRSHVVEPFLYVMVQQSHCKNVIMAPQETNTCIKPGNSSKNASRHDSLQKNRVYGCFMISLCNGKVPRLRRVTLFPTQLCNSIMSLVCQKTPQKQENKKLLFCCLLHFSKTASTNKQLQQFIQPCSLFLLILSSFGHNHLIALCFFFFSFFSDEPLTRLLWKVQRVEYRRLWFKLTCRTVWILAETSACSYSFMPSSWAPAGHCAAIRCRWASTTLWAWATALNLSNKSSSSSSSNL